MSRASTRRGEVNTNRYSHSSILRLTTNAIALEGDKARVRVQGFPALYRASRQGSRVFKDCPESLTLNYCGGGHFGRRFRRQILLASLLYSSLFGCFQVSSLSR